MIFLTRSIENSTEQTQKLLQENLGNVLRYQAECNGCSHRCIITFRTPKGFLCVSEGKLAELFSSLCVGLARADDITKDLNGLNSRTFVVRPIKRFERWAF